MREKVTNKLERVNSIKSKEINAGKNEELITAEESRQFRYNNVKQRKVK